MKRKTNKSSLRITLLTLAILVLAAVTGAAVYAEGEQEQVSSNIVSQCRLQYTSNNVGHHILYDNSYGVTFIVKGEGEQSITVDLKGNTAAGVYLKWGKKPIQWTLEATLDDGQIVRQQQGQLGLFQEYVELPSNTVSFRIVTDNGIERPIRLVEMGVYTPGTLPGEVHIWEPTPTKAELLLVSTHQDDELLFFGGAIPYYAGELNYDTIVAYTAYDTDNRIHEALDGLWICGCTQNPIFLYHRDMYSKDIELARRHWDENLVIKDLTRLLLQHQPQVVLTQDIDGEYGHGQHLLTVHCVRQALEKAIDTAYISENLPGMEPWMVKKCYLHLYEENSIYIPWETMMMESAGGKSSFDVMRRAYEKCHISQHTNRYNVDYCKLYYDCSAFGLYWTDVGLDANKNDFFEHVTPRSLNVQPQDDIPDYLERVSSTGWLYRCVSEQWTGSEYLKHCSVNGVSGWYAADYTGTLLEPVEPVVLAMDDVSLNPDEYETLELISESPRLYRYTDGLAIGGLVVRYCAIGSSEAAFYLAESDGTLVEPLTKVEVSYEKIAQPTEPQQTEIVTEPEPSSGGATHIVIAVMCSLMVFVALVLSVAVIRLSTKNKRRPSR